MPYSWDAGNDQSGATAHAFSFHDARKAYDDVAVAKNEAKAFYTFKSPLPRSESPYPIIVGIDTTGSMEEWPAIFFEKLPLLYREAVKYLPGCEISFQAINDYPADGADVALQPAPFGKGPQLDEFIGQLYPYGGGGGQVKESYEIFAAYNSLVEAPQAVIRPIAIILGDEGLFDRLPAAVAAHYGFEGGAATTREVFRRLHAVCDVFLVRKPYYGLGEPDAEIVAQWRESALMPEERILGIEDPRRVVDVILGILGLLTGNGERFEEELRRRQTPDQVTQVLGSLHTMQLALNQGSVTRILDAGAAKTRRLDLDA